MKNFDKLLSAGFDLMVAATSAPTLTRDGHTVNCVTTPLAASKELREAGFWPKFNMIAELKRTDYQTLSLADRSVVFFRQAGDTTSAGVALTVIGIEDDPADPCVKITLKEEPGPARPR